MTAPTTAASYALTLWPGGLYNIDTAQPVTWTWDELVQHMTTHAPAARKTDAPGFGPYVLTTPPRPCWDHRDGRERAGPHRCDRCVARITLAVFDVDHGTVRDMLACNGRLHEAELARIWYTSYSYQSEPDGDLDRPAAHRLILPLSEPVAPAVWPMVRAGLLARYGIPADPKTSSGRSHFYFAPSHPPGARCGAFAVPGDPVNVRLFTAAPAMSGAAAFAQPRPDWHPPPEPDTPIDLGPARSVLADRLDTLKPRAPAKAEALRRLLAGEQLSDHGRRNQTTLEVCWLLAHTLPDATLGTLLRLMEPSVESMLADGSRRVTWPTVERMLLTAMRARDDAKAQDAEIKRALHDSVDAVRRRALAARAI